MKRSQIIIVLSLLLVVSIAFVAIMVYTNRDVIGGVSYEETKQNFINNEPYFQKTDNEALRKKVKAKIPYSTIKPHVSGTSTVSLEHSSSPSPLQTLHK